jgi:hypothetical protein
VTATMTLPIRLRVAERANNNAPSADRIVCRGRAGNAAPRASVLDGRQPTEREVEAAATGGPATRQGSVSIRIASSRSNRRTWPAHCLLCQFGLARLVSAGRRADAATLGHPRKGPLGPTSRGPSAVTAECWGAVTPSSCFGGGSANRNSSRASRRDLRSIDSAQQPSASLCATGCYASTAVDALTRTRLFHKAP